MTGHGKWDLLRKLNNLPVSIRTEEMVAYTQGYILALEDVLQDAGRETEWALQTHSDPEALARLVDVVIESLENARSTLEALTRKKVPDELRVRGVQETGP